MTGAGLNHNTIVLNIGRELSAQLKKRPCRAVASGMKVSIQSANAGTYPGLLAFCGAPDFQDERQDLLLNPCPIIEVLSKSTEAYDRGDKFAMDRLIPSLREYLLVSQYRVQAERYTRGADGRWPLSEFNRSEDRIPLASVDCELALDEVYDKVEFVQD